MTTVICHKCQQEISDEVVNSVDGKIICSACLDKMNPDKRATVPKNKTETPENLTLKTFFKGGTGLTFGPNFLCIENLTVKTFFKGRMGRRDFALNYLCMIFIVPPFCGLMYNFPANSHWVTHLIFFILWILVMLWALRFFTLRFHDIYKSGPTILLGLIPIYNIFLLVILFGRKGQEGKNLYGSPCINRTSSDRTLGTGEM